MHEIRIIFNNIFKVEGVGQGRGGARKGWARKGWGKEGKKLVSSNLPHPFSRKDTAENMDVCIGTNISI